MFYQISFLIVTYLIIGFFAWGSFTAIHKTFLDVSLCVVFVFVGVLLLVLTLTFLGAL
jgi:hypothetical protein